MTLTEEQETILKDLWAELSVKANGEEQPYLDFIFDEIFDKLNHKEEKKEDEKT